MRPLLGACSQFRPAALMTLTVGVCQGGQHGPDGKHPRDGQLRGEQHGSDAGADALCKRLRHSRYQTQ